jgi:prevent-host-death family protein
MKTITAKDFQLKQASVLKEVAAGQEYEVTFHRKPIARLIPASPHSDASPKPGTRAAFENSLKYTIKSQGDLHELSYNQLRDKMMEDKYGE